MSKKSKKVGYEWRTLAWNRRGEKVEAEYRKKDGVDFDELVIDDFLHIEKMQASAYWARIGDVRMWIQKDRDGRVTVNIERGQYGEERGFTEGGK